MITAAKLQALMPHCNAAQWFAPLYAAMAARSITGTLREAAFLAHAAHESAELTRLEENLGYSSAQRLLLVFPKHFADEEEAWGYVGQPQRIASRVYANRMGNGPESSGDGWRFRGRGIFQLTGRNNYRAYGAEQDPDRVATVFGAADSAAWFWDNRGLNTLADAGDFKGTTRAINGGFNGWLERKRYYDVALGLLA